MKREKILALIFLIAGISFSGMVFFAGKLGLDTHSGWGKLRILAFVMGLLIVVFASFLLLFSNWVGLMVAGMRTRIGQNPFALRLLKSRPVDYLQKYSFAFPIMAFVILIYIWLVSSGTWLTWISPTHYYADLARGFERGKLFITVAPDPRLKELSDPYEPSVRRMNGIETPVDVSYFNGRYYLYWGPVPALLLLPIQHVYHGRVGDMQLTFGFTCGMFMLLSIFAIFIWERFFDGLPKWMLGMSLFLLGMASPTLFMLNNYNSASIYEAAVVGGQFFLISGLLIAVTTLERPASYLRLVLTGCLWALAVGTRLSLLLPIGIMALVLFWSWLLTKASLFGKAARTFSLAFPLLLGGLSLGWYNWARFGSVTESGLYYQLVGGIDLQKNYHNLIQPLYIIQNLYNYLIHPFAFDTQFPFVQVQVGRMQTVLASVPLPGIYGAQRITGLLITVPFVLFAVVPFWQLYARKYEDQQGKPNSLYWIVLLLGGSFAAAFVFLMFFFFSAMRYLDDFMPSLLILSLIGFWQGYAAFESGSLAYKWYTMLGASLMGLSIFVSLLLAISINDARFGLVRILPFLK